MKIRTYSSEGVVLSRKNFKESDRIVVCFTKHFGKLSLLAKGVRKIKSRKRGHIEVFSKVKLSAVKANGMDILTETETLNDFSGVRTNLNKISLAYYFCEVISKITKEDGGSFSIYNVLVSSLESLEEETELKKLRLNFIYKLLTEMGYWPEGKKLVDADIILDEVLERNLNSIRVGKKMLE